MKAVILDQFGDSGNFRFAEVPDPIIKPGHLLIKIKAAAFNPIDFQIRKGLSESKLLHSPILGREMSGIVVETTGSSDFNICDEVFAYVGSLGSNGTYAEYISLPYQLVSAKPQKLSFEEAAAVPMVALTALQCVERLNPQKESSVFVAGGAGGVGAFMIKLLIARGNTNIVTTAGNETSRSTIRAYGLDNGRIIDYRSEDLFERAYEINNNKLFDYCIDIVGGMLSDICSRLICINGSYADITFLGSSRSKELLFDKGATIYNISNYAYSLDERSSISYYGQKLDTIRDLIESGTIQGPGIINTGKLSVLAVQKAHEMMEQNGTQGKKLVMSID